MARSSDHRHKHFSLRELIYLVLCGVAAVAAYFAWRYMGLSHSHAKAEQVLKGSESLNDH
jgi:protein-S-isoprenylcysteine O-methyltransferase Ste14